MAILGNKSINLLNLHNLLINEHENTNTYWLINDCIIKVIYGVVIQLLEYAVQSSVKCGDSKSD